MIISQCLYAGVIRIVVAMEKMGTSEDDLAEILDKALDMWSSSADERSRLLIILAETYKIVLSMNRKSMFEISDMENHVNRRFMSLRREMLAILTRNRSKVSLSIGCSSFFQKSPWSGDEEIRRRRFAFLEAQFVDKDWKLRRVLLDVVHINGEIQEFDDISKLPGYDKYNCTDSIPNMEDFEEKFMRLNIFNLDDIEMDDLTFMKNRLIGHLLDKALSVHKALRNSIGIISVYDEYSSNQLQAYNPTKARVLGDIKFKVEEAVQNAIYDSTLFDPLQSVIVQISKLPNDPQLDNIKLCASDAINGPTHMHWEDIADMLAWIDNLKDVLGKMITQPIDFKMFREAKKYNLVMARFLADELKKVKPTDCGAQLRLFITMRKDLESIKSISNFGSKLISNLGKLNFDPAWIIATIVDPRHKLEVFADGKIPGWSINKAKSAFKLRWRESGGEDEAEVESYLNAALLPASEDAFQWWKNNAQHYPVISRVARDYLPVIGVSDPELYINTAGNSWDDECDKIFNKIKRSEKLEPTLGDFPRHVENVRMLTCLFHWLKYKSELNA